MPEPTAERPFPPADLEQIYLYRTRDCVRRHIYLEPDDLPLYEEFIAKGGNLTSLCQQALRDWADLNILQFPEHDEHDEPT